MRAREGTKERWRGLRTTRHLGRRILILYAITAAAVAAVFSTALLVNWLGTLTLAASDEQGIRIYQNLVTLQGAESNSTSQLITYLTSGETEALSQYRVLITVRQRAYEQLAAEATDTRTNAAVKMLQPQWSALDTIADQAIAERAAGTMGTVRVWQLTSGETREAITRQFTAIAKAQETVHTTTITEAEHIRTVTITLTFIFATATALLGLWITRRIIMNITVPLEALANAAAAIGAGHLETRVAPGLSAEFDMLGGVMNTMATSLNGSRNELQTALDATERRNRELRLLSEVGDALDSSLDMEMIIERSLQVVLQTFGAHDGVVILYDEGGESWRWRETSEESVFAGRAFIAAALREALGDPTIEQGHLTVTAITDARHGVADTLVIVPLDAAVRTHGVLALMTAPGWIPDEREQALLEQIGGQIARAIENVQLYIAEKGRSAEAGMLAQMAQLTTGTLDLDRLARLIARYAVDVLGVERCIIGFFDPRSDTKGRGVLQRLYQYGFQPQQAALVEGERESLQAIVRRHMLEGQALIVTDARHDQRPEVIELARRLNVRSFVSVPLIARDRRLGLIYLDTSEPRQHGFGAQDQRILAAIADQAAAAIDGARLFEAERRRGAELRVLNQTSQQIAATTHLDGLFESVTTTIRENFGYERVQIGLIEEDELVFVAVKDITGDTPEERIPLDGDSHAAWVVREGQPRAIRGERNEGAKISGIIVPLRSKDSTVGVLAVAGRPGGRSGMFDADDERLLLSLGDQLGIAVEKNRLQERALSLAVVEERNRLARDLHDSVTQSLFSMNLTIEAARLLLHRDTAAAERQLINLSDRTKETLAEMRNLIYSLRPAEMEDQGLIVALKRWGERVRHEHLLPVEVVITGSVRLRLTEVQERELFRVAQEALNNVVKHAQATQAKVHLNAMPTGITLLIEDDGVGFATSAPLRADAFGTRGMRERVKLLGGEIQITSQREQGTQVLVTIPRVAMTTPGVKGGRQQSPLMPETIDVA
jgi:nitrate/nitrite-specific signal transduction histidine kinase